ncbi:hypothetical protein DERF_014446 [Dermatophagoides farinae]|uniref:Uncharacterized protein n=1 Tax=Dermatophagoides farinae TaxID=6954 RepID=A0A922HMB7_DERFA|nr:hypothetical protein DERF_014446 [Dermatophagoides farinae]
MAFHIVMLHDIGHDHRALIYHHILQRPPSSCDRRYISATKRFSNVTVYGFAISIPRSNCDCFIPRHNRPT